MREDNTVCFPLIMAGKWSISSKYLYNKTMFGENITSSWIWDAVLIFLLSCDRSGPWISRMGFESCLWTYLGFVLTFSRNFRSRFNCYERILRPTPHAPYAYLQIHSLDNVHVKYLCSLYLGKGSATTIVSAGLIMSSVSRGDELWTTVSRSAKAFF